MIGASLRALCVQYGFSIWLEGWYPHCYRVSLIVACECGKNDPSYACAANLHGLSEAIENARPAGIVVTLDML